MLLASRSGSKPTGEALRPRKIQFMQMRASDPATARARWRRRARSALQFGLALGVVLALGFAVDPVVERFRRRDAHAGWQRFRPPHETSALLLEGDHLWAGGRDGLSLFDWRHAVLLPLPEGTPRLERVRALLLDRQGRLWVAHGGGVERRSAGQWAHLDSGVGAAAAVAEGPGDHVRVGGERGLARLERGAFRPERDSAALGMEGIDALLVDRAGNLWVASAHPVRGGAGRLTPAGVWEDFTHAPGLAHPAVSSFFEDREGGVWFASGFGKRGGACRLRGGAWTRLTRADGLASDRVRQVYEDGAGRLWVSSEVDGTAVRVDGRWRVLTPNEGMTGWEVKSVAETSDGCVWLATEDGVTRLAPTARELNSGVTR